MDLLIPIETEYLTNPAIVRYFTLNIKSQICLQDYRKGQRIIKVIKSSLQDFMSGPKVVDVPTSS